MRPASYNPLKLARLNVDTLSLRLVPAKTRVLELGCSSGYLGRVMVQELGCSVIGVEIDEKAGKKAKKYLNKVIIGDIENPKTFLQITQNGPYDVIFASAILEHLRRPQNVITKLTTFLTRDGFFIITLPNIAHWTTRLLLLRGDFEYRKTGILDRTHLYFYTLKTARELLRKANLKILKEDFEFFGPKPLSLLFPIFPNLFAYQVVLKARPKNK